MALRLFTASRIALLAWLGLQALPGCALLAGEPTPAPDSATTPRAKRMVPEITEKERAYWAFQPIQKPALPQVAHASWPANPIDSFVVRELEAKGLMPNPPAGKRELMRRVYFDLIGLPPTIEEIERFEKDPSPQAYEKVIDRLLALPQYGERWGRHWLDIVRFAQSNGYELDNEKPFAWRYRDYVIQAFNEDKPYDRFVIEQLAGDELPETSANSIVATGFQRLGVWDNEPDDKRMAEFDELDDIISTTGAAFLGLTLSCARCHDHKFDPISQTDYYQFLAFFRNIRLNENPSYALDSASYTPLENPRKVRAWQADRETRIKSLSAQLAASVNAEEKKKLEANLNKLKADSGPFAWGLAVKDRSPNPIPTHVLTRGNAGTPGAEVHPAFLTVLGGEKPRLANPSPEAQSTGRRLALAQWIASPRNPLTARVLVNRLWQHHFGKGLVKITTDFGQAGIPPTHPRLLDWLAAEFIEAGWSIKKMHKLILLSQTYRQSSSAQNADALKADPGNDLLWRQSLRRLEAEALRDTILSVSGQLDLQMTGRGFFPHLGGEVLAGASRPGRNWEISSEQERSRRSVYTHIKRSMLVPILEGFDYNNTASPLGERPITTVAPQALTLLNDDFIQEQASAFAARLSREAGKSPRPQIHRAFQLAVGREPSEGETETALGYLDRQARSFEQLRSRLTFSPDVPFSLEAEFMARLKPADFLIGPRAGWNYYRGRWAGAYEGIRTMERGRGPFALYAEGRFADGTFETKLMLHKSSELGGLLFRANAEGDLDRGYEVLFDPRQQRVTLRRHDSQVAILAEATARIPTGLSFPVKIEAAGPRLRVWCGEGRQPAIDVTDAQPMTEPGCVGIRTWGSALSLDDLTLRAGDRIIRIPDAVPEDEARRRALQSFCLLMLNLNEVVYVD